MQHKRRGQSMVEMALLLPLFLVLIFGIIDMGYIIYSYATLYQATREAAEVASVAPPYPSKVRPATESQELSDPCVAAIVESTRRYQTLLPNIEASVRINYPNYRVYRPNDPIPAGYNVGDPVRLEDRRNLGYPIEVMIDNYEIRPLTPLWDLLPLIRNTTSTTDTNEVVFRISTTARRTISSLGRDPSAPQLIACQE